ncbi:fibronectin type III domain-containing protein [Chloroflexota bacterium]
MNSRKWLILLLAIVTVMSLVTYTGVTRSLFTDDEKSTDDALGIRWGLFTLNDGFEDTVDWDANWDENGTTTWIQDSAKPHTDIYNAYSDLNSSGYLTSDEIEASTTSNITVSFWFNTKSMEAGDFLVQRYDGTAYVTWYDITTYPTYVNNAWCQFNEMITDPQYLIAGFRLRFDTSGLVDANEEANIDDVVITTDTVPPSVPAGLVANGGDEEISLDWNDNSEGDLWGYNVYRSTTGGGPYSQINGSPVPDSDYTDTGLYGGGTYYYVVTAIDYGNNESGDSNQAGATATNAPPSAPDSFNATAGDELISLNWNDNDETDLDGYNVYRSLTSGGTYNKINGTLLSTSNYTDTPLYGGGTFYYKVTAVDNVSAESSFSDIVSALANDIAPAAPASVNATGGDELITIEWTPGSEGDLWGYNIYRSDSTGEPYDQIDTVTAPTSNYTDTPLYGEVTRYYVVKAVDNGSNESPYSPEANATTTDVTPAAPTGLSAEASSEAIILDWNDNIETDNIRYNVYRSPINNSSYSLHASLVTTSDYTDSGLYGGRTYYYKVTAVDDADPVALESAYSGEVNAVATDVAPSPPTSVNANNGNEEILLTWTESVEPDVVGYKVFRGTSSGNCTELIDTLGITDNYTDTPLYGGGTYYYVITAFDEANPTAYDSADSSEVNAIAFDVAPAAPTGVNATGGDEEILITWTENIEPDVVGYNVHRSDIPGGPYSQIASLGITDNYTDTPLYGGGTYYYVVTAVDNGTNESAESAPEASALANDITPQPPQNLSANAGDGLIELDWDDNIETDNITYNIYRSLTSGNYTAPIESLWASSNYTDTGLTGGETYYYVVTAVDNGSNESDPSNEVWDTPIDNPPAAPTGLSATRGNQKITLNWDDNGEGDLAGYNIYRSLTSDNYTTPLVSLWTSSDYTNTGLTAGVTYYYVVTAVDANSNESSTSNETSATPWAPWLWTQTTQGDFEAGVSANVSTTLSSGNVILSAGGDAGGANMTLFWDGGTAPTGWTIVSDVGGDFYQKFPRGEETYGGTGGAATHTHTATFSLTSAGSGSVNIGTGTNAGAATDTHTHTLSSSTISTDSNLPVYRNLQVIKYTGGGGVPTIIPAGAIAIFDTTLPAGWTRYSAQDNYFVQGEAAAGGTGGSANHTHTVSITTDPPTGTTTVKTPGALTYATDTHTHSETDSPDAVSNEPPYVTVILAKADSDTAIPAGMISMFDASPTGNWDVLSGSGGDFHQNFLLGSDTYGSTGGSGSHNHGDQVVTLTSVTGTASNGKNTQAVFASATHTHTVDVTAFSNVSTLPPYINVVFAKAMYYSEGTIASQVLDTTYTGSEWPELAWDMTLPSGTDITFEVRASDTVFLKTDTILSWTSVGDTSPVTTGLPSGSYKQWRAILTPDGSRTSTPTLQEVRVYYQGD